MEVFNLKDMKGGWFIGNFIPTVMKTSEFEVAVKEYKAGAIEEAHFHKIATEYTLVVRGTVLFNDFEVTAGEIAVLKPGEINEFKALTDVITVVVKTPSVIGDKYRND